MIMVQLDDRRYKYPPGEFSMEGKISMIYGITVLNYRSGKKSLQFVKVLLVTIFALQFDEGEMIDGGFE